MGTEDRADRYIDEMRPYQALFYLLKALEAPKAVRRARRQIYAAIHSISNRLLSSRTGRLIYVGAGTSGRLGALDRSELWPTYGWPKNRARYILAGGHRALTDSVEGAEDDGVEAVRQIERMKIGPRDVVVGVAASGRTPFVVSALQEANLRGALTVGVASNDGSPVLRTAAYPIFLDTGAEPIAGSTRMKAGGAQHVLMKTISTLVMVRLGYVYKGLMVNVRATNEKLRARAARMVMQITSCSEECAEVALEKCDWEVGIAVLVVRGVSVSWAKKLYIDLCGRNLAQALAMEDLIDATAPNGLVRTPVPVSAC